MTEFFENIDEGIVDLVVKALGLKVFLHNAPQNQRPPYCTYNGNITTVPSLRGDGEVSQYSRQFQVDYWGTVAHDKPETLRRLREGINGKRITLVGNVRCKVSLSSVSQVVEPQGDNLTHFALTGEVQHNTQAG